MDDVATYAEQWARERMEGATSRLAREGYGEGISGHISGPDPELEDRLWISPPTVHFDVRCAGDMMCQPGRRLRM